MLESRLGSGLKRLFVYCLVFTLAVPIAPLGFAADTKVDLDANPLNGKESKVQTTVLQSFPVQVENVVTNNAHGTAFNFKWPGAGPGGFDSVVTNGPDVGTKWTWTTVSQVYSITTPAEFEPDDRAVPVFGAPSGGIQAAPGERVFSVPGKSIYPTQVTVSSASLTSSLVTFFSPENTIASCASKFVPGRFEQTITNNTGETVTFTVEEPDCCPEEQMTICDDGCKSYLTDDANCGGCGIACAYDEFCDAGACADICPGAGQEYCSEVCVDSLSDDANCGGCDVACAYDEFCDAGTCADICPGAGQEYCSEVCVDSLNDDANCGGCGVACAYDEFCDAGTCADICPGAGQEYCNQACVDTFNDDSNCGDCGVVCAFDEFCSGGACGPICPGLGQAYCNQVCVDTLGDETHCGMCGVTCAYDEFCDQGGCADICPGVGQEYCNTVCVDTRSDETNCGDCNITCSYDEFCDAGTCADICPGAGQEYCDEVCVDTLSDADNCGECGIACGAEKFCSNGTCEPICSGGELCDDECVNLDSDPLNCGSCGNVCDANSICNDAHCIACMPPKGTNCNNKCVNTQTDPTNCGECGFVCDFSDCPSGGPGACSMGSSCVCDVSAAADEGVFGFSPTWTNVPRPQYSAPASRAARRPAAAPTPGLDSPAPPPTQPAAEIARPVEALPAAKQPQRSDVRLRRDRVSNSRDETRSIPGVEEAPVCGVPPIAMEIPDGESFTLCQSGSLIGKEVFTTASIQAAGKTLGQGPCALIVPDLEATVAPFAPSPVAVTIIDESGDSLLQPGEFAQVFIKVLNVGNQDMLNPMAVLSSSPDGFNPLPMTFLNDTSAYPDFPALQQPADCDTEAVLTPMTNLVAFSLTIPSAQEGGVGRLFNLHLQGDVGGPSVADMALVLGIGESCEVGPDFQGTAYDGLAGFEQPVNADLAPLGYPTNYGTRSFSRSEDVPLILRIKCGEQVLGINEFELTPEIFAITHSVAGELPLTNINAAGPNSNAPFFGCSISTCEFLLNTSDLPVGRLRIDVRMPDSRVFQAGIRIIP